MAIDLQGSTNSDGAVRNVHVSPDNRLMTASKSNPRAFYVSRDDKRAFNAVFEDASAAAGNYVAYILNTSATRNMFINLLRVGAVNAALWKVVTATGTATGGSAVTGVNLNRGSGITPEATMLADNIGGFAAGTPLLASARSAANTSVDISFNDLLILTPQTAIAVEYDTGTTGIAEVLMRFYYEDAALDA